MPHQADRMRPDAARKKVAGTEDPVLAPLPHLSFVESQRII